MQLTSSLSLLATKVHVNRISAKLPDNFFGCIVAGRNLRKLYAVYLSLKESISMIKERE